MSEGTIAQPIGVGMPALLYLHEFGRLVEKVFGAYPILVGSALHGKNPRDIDVRCVVDDIRQLALLPDSLSWYVEGGQWAVICMAFSALGQSMTGLPVDFQIQEGGARIKYSDQPRYTLGCDRGRTGDSGRGLLRIIATDNAKAHGKMTPDEWDEYYRKYPEAKGCGNEP